MNITVQGRPAPQGSKRHVGHGVLIESSKRVKPWREAVKEACYTALAGKPPPKMDGPVYVDITFYFERPKSAKKIVVLPTTRSTGDLDKLLRSTFDALTDAGIIMDDARIASLFARKSFCYERAEGADIFVKLIDTAVPKPTTKDAT